MSSTSVQGDTTTRPVNSNTRTYLMSGAALAVGAVLGGGGAVLISNPTTTVVQESATYSACFANASAGLMLQDKCDSVLRSSTLFSYIHTPEGKTDSKPPLLKELKDVVTLQVVNRTKISGCTPTTCKNWWNAVSQTDKYVLTVAYHIPKVPVNFLDAYLSVVDKASMKEVFNKRLGDRRAPYIHNNKAYGLDHIGSLYAPPGYDIRLWELDLDTLEFSYIGGEKSINKFFETKGGEYRYQFYGHQIGFMSKQDECGGYMFVSRGEIGYFEALSYSLADSSRNRLTAPSSTDYRGNVRCICTTPSEDGSLMRCPNTFGESDWWNGDVHDYYEEGEEYTIDESFLNKERSDFTGGMNVIDCSSQSPLSGIEHTRLVPDHYVVTLDSTVDLVIGGILVGEGLVKMEVINVVNGNEAHLSLYQAHYNTPSSLPFQLNISDSDQVTLQSIDNMHFDFLAKDFNSSSNPTTILTADLPYDSSYDSQLISLACSVPTVKFSLITKFGEGNKFDKTIAQSFYSQGASIWNQGAVDEEVGMIYFPSGNAQMISVDRFFLINGLKKRIVAKWIEIIQANNEGSFQSLREASKDMTSFNEEYDSLRTLLSSKDQLVESGIIAVNLTTGKTVWARSNGGTDGYFAFLGSFDAQFSVFATEAYQEAAKAINYFDIDCNAMYISDDRQEDGFRGPIVGCKSGVYSKYTSKGEKIFSSQAGPPAVDLFRGAPNNYGSTCMSEGVIVFSAAPEYLQLQGLTNFNITQNPTGWLSPSGERIGWGVSMTTALDANSGDILWTKPINGMRSIFTYTQNPNPVDLSYSEGNPHKTMVPTCSGGKVFTLCQDDRLACIYHARTGELMGTFEAFGSRTDIFKDINMHFDGQYAYSHNGAHLVYKYKLS